MIAILRYGPFLYSTMVLKKTPTIEMMKPLPPLSSMATEQECATPLTGRLIFSYMAEPTKGVFEYIFVGES